MVKKAHLHAHLTSAELKNRYLSSSNRVESRRGHLLRLVSKSWTIKQAAQAVRIAGWYSQRSPLPVQNLLRQQGQRLPRPPSALFHPLENPTLVRYEPKLPASPPRRELNSRLSPDTTGSSYNGDNLLVYWFKLHGWYSLLTLIRSIRSCVEWKRSPPIRCAIAPRR